MTGVCQGTFEIVPHKVSSRCGDLINHYEVSLSEMLHGILGHDHIQWHPQLIRHYTNLWTYYRIEPYYQLSPRAHVAKFYGRLRLIRSVLRASKISVLKLIEIVILWVYYTIPFGFSLFWHFRAIIFNFWIHIVWLRITDDGSLPEMRIWSILIIESD